MIIVISYTLTANDIVRENLERYYKAGDKVVSHGIDMDTGKTIIMSQDRWDTFTRTMCEWNEQLGEWVLK